MPIRRYEMPWRHAYEAYAGLAWGIALMFFTAVGAIGQLPHVLAFSLSIACLGIDKRRPKN